MKYNLKFIKSKYLLMVYIFAVIFCIQISIQAQNSKGISKLPVYEGDISILNNLDSLSLQGLEIEVNHNRYFWLNKSNQFQNDNESTKSIILFNKNLIAISDNLNQTLGEVKKLMLNVKLIGNPEFRNILSEILDDIDNLLGNLEEFNNRISEQ